MTDEAIFKMVYKLYIFYNNLVMFGVDKVCDFPACITTTI